MSRRLKSYACRYAAMFLAAATLALATGCAAPAARELWADLSAKGAAYGFAPLTVSTPPFALSALLKTPQNGTAPEYLVVYLEGDGRVLTPQGTVRDDPTPSKTLVFDLAALDPAPAVLYLARIGQFQPQDAGPGNQTYWSEGRLGPDAVQAAAAAVTALKERTGARRVYLIGFSGGGGLACLLAARRDDVAGLVTVAGLLDHDWWTTTNNYPALTASLNPADFAAKLADIPQIHFYGLDDTLISPAMSARFAGLADFKDLTRVAVPGGHDTGWQKAWPGLLQNYVLPMRERTEELRNHMP